MACDFRKKMQFKSPSVTFMGQKLTDRGVEPDPAKVAAITEMPAPTDKSGVQRFLDGVLDGVLYRSYQVIVPAVVRDDMLQKIQSTPES